MWHPIQSRGRSTPERSQARRNRTAVRPRLEALEGRVVLSLAFESVNAMTSAGDPAVDSAGNTYVTGTLRGTVDYDPGIDHSDGSDILTARGDTDPVVVKYAPDGTFLWARRMGSDYVRSTNPNDPFEVPGGLAVDAAGNAYFTGVFVGQADFGPITLTAAGSSTDVFVAKISPDGDFLWAQKWGGSSTREFGQDIVVDGGGDVISVGFTASLTSNGAWYSNGFEIHKYSPTGAATWAVRYSNLGGTADAVATDTAGNVYVTGSFNGTLDFNADRRKTHYVSGASGYSGGQAYNAYVLKLTASGAFGWVSPFVAKRNEASNSAIYGQDLAVDASGNVVVGGYYRGQVDINPNTKIDTRLPNLSSSDGFVARLSPTGSLIWATPLAGTRIRSLVVDAAGSAYAIGESSNWLGKLDASGQVDWTLSFEGSGNYGFGGIAVDSDSTVHLTGGFSGTVDFDPDPLGTAVLTSDSQNRAYLLKLRQT